MHSRPDYRTTGVLLTARPSIIALGGVARGEPAAPRFNGTYLNSKLSVEISGDPGNYTGTIRMGEQKFPLTARAQGAQLHGTFRSGENEYEFTATLSGGELTLVTGGATYVLKNANPLAKAPGEPQAPKTGNIVGKWAISGDLGDEKFTLALGPKGDMMVESSNGNSSSGPTYAYANNTITFDGSTSINKLSLGGSWKLEWKSADEFVTTDDQGKTLTLRRVTAVQGK